MEIDLNEGSFGAWTGTGTWLGWTVMSSDTWWHRDLRNINSHSGRAESERENTFSVDILIDLC